MNTVLMSLLESVAFDVFCVIRKAFGIEEYHFGKSDDVGKTWPKYQLYHHTFSLKKNIIYKRKRCPKNSLKPYFTWLQKGLLDRETCQSSFKKIIYSKHINTEKEFTTKALQNCKEQPNE